MSAEGGACGGRGGLKPVEAAFAEADAAAAPKARAKEVEIGRAEEIPLGGRKIVQVGHLSIGVFRLADGFYALRNYCPHQGAELCKGTLHATHRPGAAGEFTPALAGRVLRCPWHGWEFDLETGRSLLEPKRVGLKTYRVTQEDGQVVLHT